MRVVGQSQDVKSMAAILKLLNQGISVQKEERIRKVNGKQFEKVNSMFWTKLNPNGNYEFLRLLEIQYEFNFAAEVRIKKIRPHRALAKRTPVA